MYNVRKQASWDLATSDLQNDQTATAIAFHPHYGSHCRHRSHHYCHCSSLHYFQSWTASSYERAESLSL